MGVNNLNNNLKFSPLLTGVAKRFPSQKFAGVQMAPIVSAAAKEGYYIKYGRENMRADGLRSTEGVVSKEIYSSRDKVSYECEKYAGRQKVFDEDVDPAAGDDLQSLKEASTFNIRERMLLEREVQIAAVGTANASFTSGGITNYAAAGTAWDTSSTSILNDIALAINAVHENTGVMPTHIFIPAKVQILAAQFEPFKSWLERGINASQGLTPYGLPATFPQFSLKIVTLEAMKDVAGFGGSNVSLSDVWSDNVIIAHVNPNWKNRALTWLSTFSWIQKPVMESGIMMREYYQEDIEATWVDGKEWYDIKVVEALCGYKITSTLTS